LNLGTNVTHQLKVDSYTIHQRVMTKYFTILFKIIVLVVGHRLRDGGIFTCSIL
jgi:hypothetical protein